MSYIFSLAVIRLQIIEEQNVLKHRVFEKLL